jgi:cellulose synthase/poly-beta-1,6-N-acetylglucosamine synthase-like glycosyltransferase
MENIQLITEIFLSLAIAYFFFYLYMLSHSEPQKKQVQQFPAVSVLVALRNEESNILNCCGALDELDYPQDKIEILMLNDNSSDNSGQLIADFIRDKKKFRLINITEDKNGLSGKINALAQAIQNISSEYVFITDADCQPDSGWIKTLLAYYDEKTALISGFTIMEKDNPGFLDKLQTFDMIYLQSMAFLASNSNRPVTMLGNNITFRRSVYKQVGGYEAIGFTVNEDHDLMKAILEKTEYNVRYIRDRNGPVKGLPMPGFISFIQQRLRWMVGGLNARLFAYVLVGLSFIIHSGMVILTATAQWNGVSATAIGLILGIDYLVLKQSMKSLDLKINPFQFLSFEVFYIFYTHILILLLPFSRTVNWKGRKYIKKETGLVKEGQK